MDRTEAMLRVVIGLVLGVGIMACMPVARPEFGPSASASGPVAKTLTATRAPLEEAGSAGSELEDVLLLYDSTQISSFDVNFCRIAEYYGLECKRVALDTVPLTNELLMDRRGHYFRLIGTSANTLLGKSGRLDKQEIALIKSAVENGAGLYVGKATEKLNSDLLAELTDGAVLGSTKVPEVLHKEWTVSGTAPEITQELTGQTIPYTQTVKYDRALELAPLEAVTVLITSTNQIQSYPIFARYQKGDGSIYVDSGEAAASFDTTSLANESGSWAFSKVVPLMMALRHEMGARAWHTAHHFANLTIDDPALVEQFNQLNFAELLVQMQAHDFHTTIAFIPANSAKTKPEVAALFLEHPDRFSLVQHGNNHDGYEFYKYAVSETDTYNGAKMSARPLAEQEQDIREGLARLETHRATMGVPFDRVMIFPYNISPAPTLALLKQYNYLATVNGQALPLDAVRPPDWDYGMYQAIMDYGNFPLLLRRHPGSYQPFQPRLAPFLRDLFLGKPALFYSHSYEKELFASGVDAFNPVADQINRLAVPVEWQSLGYIVKHLYLEKDNDDGSVAVKFYANNLEISPVQSGKVYHLQKQEVLNVPIKRVTVNGQVFPYTVADGWLRVDVAAPQDGAPIEVVIEYQAEH